LDGDNFDATVGLGNVSARQGKTANAIQSFEAALEINPDSWQVRVLLGRLYVSQKRTAEAIQQLNIALQSQPKNGDLAAEYGALMMQLGQHREAVTALRIADNAKPNDPKISRLFADSLLATGATQTARIKYASAMANNPRDLESRIRLAWIMATAKDENLRDPKQAVQLAQQAISAGSNDAAARQTFAAALASGGQFQQAIQQQSAAMQMLPRRSTQFNSASRRLELYQGGKPYLQKDADAIPFLPAPE
jgi:tetratricopeptide (TPR) repeat protein